MGMFKSGYLFNCAYISVSCYHFTGGLEAFIHHHRCEPLLRLLRQVAVHHTQGEKKDQIWQKVRLLRVLFLKLFQTKDHSPHRETKVHFA